MKTYLLTLVASVVMACSNSDTIGGGVTLRVVAPSDASVDFQPTPGGNLVTLEVRAEAEPRGARDASAAVPIAGVQVTFATNVAGTTPSPTSAATTQDGTASTKVVVPFGIDLTVTASAPAAFPTSSTLSAPPIHIMLDHTLNASTKAGPAGVQATITAMTTPMVDALPLAWSTNTMGVNFVPATSVTNAQGSSSSTVFIPYSASALVGTVAGGNSGMIITLSDLLPPIKITAGPIKPMGTMTTAGTFSQVTVFATIQPDPKLDAQPIVNLPIAFTVPGMQMSPFSPTSATTDNTGVATTFVVIPMTGLTAEATASGFTSILTLEPPPP